MNRSKKVEKSTEEEIRGHTENGAFELINLLDIAKEARIFGSRLIDKIEAAHHAIRYKSRLIA